MANTEFIAIPLIIILDIKKYLTKKKKNGGKPENDNSVVIIKYSDIGILEYFNSEIYRIDIKFNKNI